MVVSDFQGGQYGNCHLPDGEIIEEWEFYRNGGKSNEELKIECESQKGKIFIEKAWLVGLPLCVTKYEDWGKSCSISSQCWGGCIVTSEQVWYSFEVKKDIQGICQSQSPQYGCYGKIENHLKWDPMVCID